MNSRPASDIVQAPIFMRKLGESPLTVVDVGARDGPHPRWEAVRPNLRVIGFEADEAECRALNSRCSGSDDRRDVFIPTALSDHTGEAELHLTRKPGCASFLRPNQALLQRFPQPERFEVVRTTVVPTDRLDRVLESLGYSADFIKLDVQGTELQVLRGAEHALEQTVFGVEVEVEFVELYQKQPLFSQVDEYLRGLGFVLFDLNRYWWKRREGADASNIKGQLICADALYLKDFTVRPEQLRHWVRTGKGTGAIKAIVIAVLYNKLDFAIELVRVAREVGDLSEYDTEEIQSLLMARRTSFCAKVPNFRGRGRLEGWLRRLADCISPPAWNRSDTI